MRIGLQIPSFSWPGGPARLGARLGEIARSADDAGFASLWVMDHFFQIPMVGPAEREMLEGWTTLGFLAGHTRRARLGTLVTGVTYRHPGVLVKVASTLDVLSGGRAWLGIGAAWFEREHRGLGVPFPPLAERFERLEETLRIAKQMWSGKVERKTLRLVARYADACNLFLYAGKQVLAQKLEVLRRHCDAVGRPYEAIEKTALGTVQLAPLEVFGKEIIPALAEL